VSGGDQKELRRVFAARGLDTLFDAGIFGSPDDKDTILARESAAGTITWPALFLGDSHLDYMAATRAGLDFVFVANWSEWQEGAALAAEGQLSLVPKLSALLNTIGNDDGKALG
jgi:phosphoglycolate phosphatase-like HAD superfamily hydrolase